MPSPIGSGTSSERRRSSNSQTRCVFLRRLGEDHLHRLEVPAGHHENVVGPLDQALGERLAADVGDIDAPRAQHLDPRAGWAPARIRADAGRGDLDVVAPFTACAKEALSHGAAADIAGADKKDVHRDGFPGKPGGRNVGTPEGEVKDRARRRPLVAQEKPRAGRGDSGAPGSRRLRRPRCSAADRR